VLISLARAYLYCLHMQLPAFPPFPNAHIDDMEQNVNTVRTTADGDHDDLGGMIPENINTLVRRLYRHLDYRTFQEHHFLHICKTLIFQ
jgi:hypothetical protein